MQLDTLRFKDLESGISTLRMISPTDILRGIRIQ